MSHHDLDVGDDLPAIALTLSPDDIRAYCAAAKMPGGRFHSDEEAHKEGLPGQIAPGNMSLALFARLLAAALPKAKVLRLSGTFRGLVRPNVAMSISGVVTERHADPLGDRLECDLVLAAASGDRLVIGTATLRLPLS